MSDISARETLMDQLDGILQVAVQGHLQIVFVVGEPGVGKTYLVSAFLKDRARQSIPALLVASATCSAVAGSSSEPYVPIIQILRDLSQERTGNPWGKTFQRYVDDMGPNLLQVLPVVGSWLSVTAQSAQWAWREWQGRIDSPEQNSRLMQYAALLSTLSSRAPLLLWLENLHLIDHATLHLIRFLARHYSDLPIMFVGTCRSTITSESVATADYPPNIFSGEQGWQSSYTEIIVPRFELREVEEYLRLRDYDFPQSFVKRLHRKSGGNPLFIHEYMISLHKNDFLARRQGTFFLAKPEVRLEIEKPAREIVADRLRTLNPQLLRILQHASIQGERFDSTVLAQTLRVPHEEVLHNLGLLRSRHQLVQVVENELSLFSIGYQYQFYHDIIRQTVYDQDEPSHRQYLHLAIAQILIEFHGEDAPGISAVLAHHYDLGGNVIKSISHYLRSAQNAINALALDDALLRISKAEQLLGKLDEDAESSAKHIELLLLLAEATHLQADFAASLQALQDAETLCVRAHLSHYLPQILFWRSVDLYRDGRYEESVKPIKEALSLIGDTQQDQRLAAILYARMGASYRAADLHEVEFAFSTALRLADKNNFSDIRAKVLIDKAGVLVNHYEKYQDALECAQEAERLAATQGMVYERLRSLEWISHALRFLDRGEEAMVVDNEAVDLARRSGLPRALCSAIHCQSISLRGVRNDWKGSLRKAQEAVSIADEHNFKVVYGVFTDWFGAAYGLGLWEEAKKSQARMRDTLPSEEVRQAGMYWWRQGLLAFVQDLYQDAILFYYKAMDCFEGASMAERNICYVVPDLSLALLAVGDVHQSMYQIDRGIRFWSTRQPIWYARTLRAHAAIDLYLGEYELAVSKLRQALGLSGCFDYHPWPTRSHVKIALSNALLASDQVDEAMEPALEAHHELGEIGHFLTGEAAYATGMVLLTKKGPTAARSYFKEAHGIWSQLRLNGQLARFDQEMRTAGISFV